MWVLALSRTELLGSRIHRSVPAQPSYSYQTTRECSCDCGAPRLCCVALASLLHAHHPHHLPMLHTCMHAHKLLMSTLPE